MFYILQGGLKEEDIYCLLNARHCVYSVLHLLFYSVLTITNLAQSIIPLIPKVSEQMNGVTRAQLDKPQNQNKQESYPPNPTDSVRRLSRPKVFTAMKTVTQEG